MAVHEPSSFKAGYGNCSDMTQVLQTREGAINVCSKGIKTSSHAHVAMCKLGNAACHQYKLLAGHVSSSICKVHCGEPTLASDRRSISSCRILRSISSRCCGLEVISIFSLAAASSTCRQHNTVGNLKNDNHAPISGKHSRDNPKARFHNFNPCLACHLSAAFTESEWGGSPGRWPCRAGSGLQCSGLRAQRRPQAHCR